VTRKSTGIRLEDRGLGTLRTKASVSPEGDHVGRDPPRLVTLRAPAKGASGFTTSMLPERRKAISLRADHAG
jgi:hypothetical protein